MTLPTPAEEARDLLTFADGYEDAGHPELARRSRVVARELLRALQALADERSTREAVQRQRDSALEVLATHAGQAAA